MNDGIRCSKCNCNDLEITHTKKLPGGFVRRYRRCRHCGKVIRTKEKEDPPDAKI